MDLVISLKFVFGGHETFRSTKNAYMGAIGVALSMDIHCLFLLHIIEGEEIQYSSYGLAYTFPPTKQTSVSRCLLIVIE